MVRVAPIKLQVGPKVLWFDPTDLDIRAGDDVIVNTSRWLEYVSYTHIPYKETPEHLV